MNHFLFLLKQLIIGTAIGFLASILGSCIDSKSSNAQTGAFQPYGMVLVRAANESSFFSGAAVNAGWVLNLDNNWIYYTNISNPASYSKLMPFNKRLLTSNRLILDTNTYTLDINNDSILTKADISSTYYPNTNPNGYISSFTEIDPTVPSYSKTLTNFTVIKSATDSIYEPLFSKNSGFNKNFGNTSGTVTEGNDTRVNNGQTAFSWGNHALAGYLTNSSLKIPKVFSAVSNSTGDISISFGTTYSVVPNVQANIIGGLSNQLITITNITTTGCTMKVL